MAAELQAAATYRIGLNLATRSEMRDSQSVVALKKQFASVEIATEGQKRRKVDASAFFDLLIYAASLGDPGSGAGSRVSRHRVSRKHRALHPSYLGHKLPQGSGKT